MENYFEHISIGSKFIFSGYAYKKISKTHAVKIASGFKLYFAKKAKVIDFI